MSIQGFNEDPLTYLTSAAFADGELATLTATAGVVGLCGAAGVPIGIADGAIASGAYGCFRPMRGRVKVNSASGSITEGQFVKCGAAGEVVVEASATTRTANTIGQAETADGAAHSQFYIVCL